MAEPFPSGGGGGGGEVEEATTERSEGVGFYGESEKISPAPVTQARDTANAANCLPTHRRRAIFWAKPRR